MPSTVFQKSVAACSFSKEFLRAIEMLLYAILSDMKDCDTSQTYHKVEITAQSVPQMMPSVLNNLGITFGKV
jgi:hypothetical protein